MGLYPPGSNPYSVYNDKHDVFEEGRKNKDKANPYIPGSPSFEVYEDGRDSERRTEWEE